jgi:quercetin dioxygenase-like cupin family protein
MKVLRPLTEARSARPADDRRPATAIIHDSADVRLVVFRLAPGQSVPPHRNPSSVMLTVLQGSGLISGANSEEQVREGDAAVFEPNEPHGMRATDVELCLLAIITPRPSERAPS